MKLVSTPIFRTILVTACLTLCNLIYAQNYNWQLLGGVTGGEIGAGNGYTIATDGINVYSAGYTVENPEFVDSGRLVVHYYNGIQKYWSYIIVGPTFNYDSETVVSNWLQINNMCTDNSGNLYIAGNFPDGYYITEWNPYTYGFDSLGRAGFSANTTVTSICSDGTNLYAAGDQYVSMWNGSTWSQVGNQNGQSVCYAGNPGFGGSLYVLNYGTIYQWTGAIWQQLGITGNYFCGSPTGVIASLNTGGNVQYIQSGLTYTIPLPTGAGNFTAITADSNYIYVAGSQGSNSVVEALAYGDSVWHILGTGGNALYYPAPVNAMCPYNGGIVITGTNVIETSEFEGEEVVYYGPNIPGPLYVTLAKAEPNCSTPGSITAVAKGGTPPYTFLWSNGANGSIDSGLVAGTYWVTVQDSAGVTNTGYAQLDSGCFALVTAFAYSDENNNCTYDTTDAALDNVLVTATNQHGQIFYANSSNGHIGMALPDTGYYYLHVTSPSACARLAACSQAYDTLHVASLHDTIALGNIAFLGGVDLTVLLNTSPASPGFNKDYEIAPFNLQAQPTAATIVFTYDPNLVYQNASGNPVVNTIAHTLTWALNANQVYTGGGDVYPYILHSAFLVPSTLSISYQLQSNFTILPYGGDCDTSNNSINVSESCLGSHDPNFKSVSPSGATSSTDSVLTYTIDFQNTGNDSTHFITVVDTLSPYLQAASVQNIASSAQYSSFSISGNGILTWVFNPYSLPDSTTDPVGSNGFITFTIKRAADVPFDTSITNQASIYFDYNLPVQTNTATDTFICQQIPPVAVVAICPNDSFNFLGQWLYAAGNYTDTVVTTTGCDSIVTLTLTVTQPLTSSTTASTCAGVPYNFNGTSITTGGTYYDTLQAYTTGCDSIVTLTLTITQPLTSSTTATTCAGSPYNFNGTSITTGGTYYDTLQAYTTGCDSIVTLTLTITQPLTSSTTAFTCAGSPYNFNGRSITAAGAYYDTLQAVTTGCDSIVTLNLTFITVVTDTITRTICQGDTFYIGTTQYTEPGSYTDTLVNASAGGCDSIVTLKLNIDNLVASMININGDTFCSQGSVVTLSCQPAGGTFMGTGVNGNQFNPVNANVGADTIYYTYTDSNHCSTISKGYVDVASFPQNITVDTIMDTVGVTSFFTQPATNGNIIWQEQNNPDDLGTNVSNGDTLTVYCVLYGVRPLHIDTLDGMPYGIRAIINLYGCVDTTAWSAPTCQFIPGGIQQITDYNAISVYPNPATDQLFIKTENISPQTITVYDVDGRMIFTQPFKPEIEINQLSSGVYFIEVTSNEGVTRKRFVKM